MYENIRLMNELSIFGRGKDKKQRKRRSDAIGGSLLVGGGLIGVQPGYVGIKTLSKEIRLRKNENKINQNAEELKKTWKDQSRKNHPDLVTDPKEKLLREEKIKQINNQYETARASKTDLDNWKQKNWKDKLKSSADDLYDDLLVKQAKAKGIDYSNIIKSPATQSALRSSKNDFIKGLKRTGIAGAALGTAGVGVLAANKVLNSNKKKKKR